MKTKSETDTPDLDKALSLLDEAFGRYLNEYPKTRTLLLKLAAKIVTEQRAEEAERCLPAFAEIGGYGRIAERAADLRRQAGGGR